MPICKRRPQITEVLNIAVSRFATLRKSQCEILERPASIWLRKNVKPINEAVVNSSNKEEGDTDHGKNKKTNIILHLEIFKRKFYENWLRLSLYSQRILEHKAMRFFGFFVVLSAFILLSYEVSSSIVMNPQFPPVVIYLDWIITACFLFEAILRFLGTLIRLKVEEAFDRPINRFEVFISSSVLDIVVISLCFSYGMSYIGLWLKFIRLLLPSASVMKLVPHVIIVLMNGITHGIQSTSLTILLLFILIMVWACMGNYFFAENDPFHFGSYAQSVLTFFQLSTFQNWSTVFYTNYGGCDSFPNEYSGGIDSPSNLVVVHTAYGTFNNPLCLAPHGQPVVSMLVFFSFTVCAGYVTISLCLATVAIGFNEYLAGLKLLQVYGANSGGLLGALPSVRGQQQNLDNQGLPAIPVGGMLITPRKRSSVVNAAGGGGGGSGGGNKATQVLLGNANEIEQIKALLVSIWGDLEHHHHAESESKKGGMTSSESRKSLKRDNIHAASKTQLALSQIARQRGARKNDVISSENLPEEVPDHVESANTSQAVKTMNKRLPSWLLKYIMPFVKDPYFLLKGRTRDILFSVLVLVDAAVQLYEQSAAGSDTAGTMTIHALVQMIFFVDYAYRIVIQLQPVEKLDFVSLQATFQWWNVTDLLSIVVMDVTIALHDVSAAKFLRSYRLFRLVSILRIASSLVSDLGVIILAVINSFVCILYLGFLLFVYFVYFAIAGVLLFQSSVPYYFADMGTSLRTMMQVMTFDNWDDVMHKCTLGCANYGFTGTGSISYQNSCDLTKYSGQGMGWLSGIYFVIFIVMSSMVVINVLVGVIISSMVSLREGYKEEEAIWARVRTLQDKYVLSEAQTSNMLLLFELLDRNANGYLTLEEVQPLLVQTKFSEAKQLELYVQADTDKNGQLDFSEFCELMMLVWAAKSSEFNQKNQIVMPSLGGGRRSAVIVPRTSLMSGTVAGDIVGLIDGTAVAQRGLLEEDDEDSSDDDGFEFKEAGSNSGPSRNNSYMGGGGSQKGSQLNIIRSSAGALQEIEQQTQAAKRML